MHREQTAVRGLAVVLGPVAVEDEVALAEDGAVAFVQLAFQGQELFVAVVAVAVGRHAGGYAVDVKAGAKLYRVVELQDFIAEGQAVGVDEGGEGGAVDIGRAAVLWVDRFHLGAPLPGC
jgi:hypothetical protein